MADATHGHTQQSIVKTQFDFESRVKSRSFGTSRFQLFENHSTDKEIFSIIKIHDITRYFKIRNMNNEKGLSPKRR